MLNGLLDLKELRKEQASRSLRNYIAQAWSVVEPASEYVPGWHIDAICEHLEAVLNGEIKNLLINIPPRHMKSLTVSVFFPTWAWIKKPSLRWLFSSYAASLSVRDSLKCRRLIQSPWYQDNWGDIYQLTGDQNLKQRFDNNKTGYRISTSVSGAATGEGGDIVVADDPHNVDDARSDTIRESTLVWWSETMSTRLNDPKTGAKIIVMQRVHERDLSGKVLEDGGYVHLCLPAEFEPNRKCITQIGWEDPRSSQGELLWPERFGPEEIEAKKKELGSYAYAGQFQQRPAPAGGGLFKREWFEIVDAAPSHIRKVRYWDFASTEEKIGTDPDYTVGCLMSEKDGIYYIEDIRRDRLSAMGVERLVKQTAMADTRLVPIWIEEEPGSSGKIVTDHYARKVLVGFAFRGNRATGSKIQRADPFAAAAEAGNVKLVQGNWNTEFLDEIETFPLGAHDDQVDAASGAFSKLFRAGELMTGVLSW